MSDSDRLKRDAPSRTGPIRNKPVATQLLERGVETAYMVVEEYMLRGRQAAGRRYQNGSANAGSAGSTNGNGRPDMSNDRQQGGSGNGSQMPPLMQPFMQMMRMWTDGMSAFVPGGGMASDWMNQWMPGMTAWTGTPTTTRAISVYISSKHPAEVTVDLEPGAEYAKLTADPLTSGDSGAPPLAAVRFECETGHVRVRVTVPTDQPGGSYAGHIHDATGARRGEVRVEIEGPRPPAGRAKKKAGRSRAK